jgi:hypothetical protein
MIAGDVFVSKIAFNTSAMDCDSFQDTSITTPAPTLSSAPTGTLVPTGTVVPTGTSAPMKTLVRNNTCIDLDTTQMGFAKFRIAMYWITFILLTGLCGYGGVALASYGWLGMLFIFLGLVLWIFLFVGGIFLSQFVFQASMKNCNNSSRYCYDLNNAKIFFAKITSIFSFISTFAITGLIVFALFKSV